MPFGPCLARIDSALDEGTTIANLSPFVDAGQDVGFSDLQYFRVECFHQQSQERLGIRCPDIEPPVGKFDGQHEAAMGTKILSSYQELDEWLASLGGLKRVRESASASKVDEKCAE